jgi:two-component system chemotaxis response regulator CheY
VTNQYNFDPSLRILVVDDQSFMRNMVKAILKGLGVGEVDTAEDGSKAINLMNAANYDAIFCDWNMPNVTGIEVLRRMRSLPGYFKVPFIMLTAEAYRENIMEAMNAGVTEYIAKPFTPDILAEKLALALKKRASNQP